MGYWRYCELFYLFFILHGILLQDEKELYDSGHIPENDIRLNKRA